VASSARLLTIMGQLATLIAFLLLPVLTLAMLLPRPRVILAFGTIVSSTLLIFLLADSQVYQLYRFHLNAGVVALLSAGAESQVLRLPSISYVQAFGIVLAAIAWQTGAAVWLWRRIQSEQRPLLRGRVAAALFGGLIVAYQMTHAWADVTGFTPVTRDASLLPLAYPLRARSVMRDLGFEMRRDSWRLHTNGGGLSYPLTPLSCEPTEPVRSIVIIVIDSWRFDAMNESTTPNIARFAARAARFGQHFSGGNATRAGTFSLFYGIPSTYWHDMLQQRRGPALVSELINHDYELGIFRSAPLESPEFHQTVFAAVDHPRMASEGEGPADWDRDLTNDFKAFLVGRDPAKPFFAFLFYDSPHTYEIPPDFPLAFQPSLEEVNYLSLRPDTDPVPFHNRYLNSVHYVDSLVGEALDQLDAAGVRDSSVIIITGDHGQEFNDNGLGFWGHNSNFTRFQTQVPLLLAAPDVPAGRHDYRTSHFDVAPTLMSRYLGCTTPIDQYSVGSDLFRPGGREALVISSYQDFAVLEPQRIISVRKTGLEVLDTSGRPAPEQALDTASVTSAIEQNSRFRLGGGPGG
jgi:membrane-anchored protein YejM (alkaline phosphatase superfamily)